MNNLTRELDHKRALLNAIIVRYLNKTGKYVGQMNIFMAKCHGPRTNYHSVHTLSPCCTPRKQCERQGVSADDDA